MAKVHIKGSGSNVSVIDVDTGKPIDHITRVDVTIKADDNLPTAVLTVLDPELDIVAEVDNTAATDRKLQAEKLNAARDVLLEAAIKWRHTDACMSEGIQAVENLEKAVDAYERAKE
jgi:hypothetical protein